ncbi:MAG: hypothetical protein ACTS3F_08885 [Phycisphaerales bacterium]
MRLKRASDSELVVRARSWAPLLVFLSASVVLIGTALVRLGLGEGFSVERVLAPLGVGALFFAGAARFGRWWTIRFDGEARCVRYRIGSLIGTRRGEIEYARISGVTTRTTRAGSSTNRRRPRHALFFLLADGSGFQITDQTEMIPRRVEELGLIASALRREVGLAEPDGDGALVDAVLSAPSRVQAVREVRARMGGSLKAARDVAGEIRGGSADGG